MPIRSVHDLNVRDFTYVVANLRQEDEEEVRALMPIDVSRSDYASILYHAATGGVAYTVHLDDVPAAAFGVGMSDSHATGIGWAFGTSQFKRTVPTISHFGWHKISHDLYSIGVLRLEARALSKHKFARHWLMKMGFNEDCELPYYGTRGEFFHQYSITVDEYNKKFSRRLS